MKLTNNHLTFSPVLSNVEGPINQYFCVLSCISCQNNARKYNKNMQNEPNLKITQIYTSSYITSSYVNLWLLSHPKNEPKRTQNEPNFGPKLGSFFPELALFSPSVTAKAGGKTQNTKASAGIYITRNGVLRLITTGNADISVFLKTRLRQPGNMINTRLSFSANLLT